MGRRCGIASGAAKRSRTAQRDAEIAGAWAAGATQAKLAQVHGFSRSKR